MNISDIADAVTSHSFYDLLKLIAELSPFALVVVIVLAIAGTAVARFR